MRRGLTKIIQITALAIILIDIILLAKGIMTVAISGHLEVLWRGLGVPIVTLSVSSVLIDILNCKELRKEV